MKEKFLLLNETLISSDIFSEHFSCDLSACRGACCWKGDYGAPLTLEEADRLEAHTESIVEDLAPGSQATFRSNGPVAYYKEMKQLGTQLNPDGSCIYMVRKNGIAQCKLELDHRSDSDLPNKPVSCHLYPIRISNNHQNTLDLVEYDRWEICKAACSKGQKEKMPVFRFVKSGLVRKYGQEFYDQLEELYQDRTEHS